MKTGTLDKALDYLKDYNGTLTPHELASAIGVSVKSINAIASKIRSHRDGVKVGYINPKNETPIGKSGKL